MCPGACLLCRQEGVALQLLPSVFNCMIKMAARSYCRLLPSWQIVSDTAAVAMTAPGTCSNQTAAAGTTAAAAALHLCCAPQDGNFQELYAAFREALKVTEEDIDSFAVSGCLCAGAGLGVSTVVKWVLASPQRAVPRLTFPRITVSSKRTRAPCTGQGGTSPKA